MLVIKSSAFFYLHIIIQETYEECKEKLLFPIFYKSVIPGRHAAALAIFTPAGYKSIIPGQAH